MTLYKENVEKLVAVLNELAAKNWDGKVWKLDGPEANSFTLTLMSEDDVEEAVLHCKPTGMAMGDRFIYSFQLRGSDKDWWMEPCPWAILGLLGL